MRFVILGERRSVADETARWIEASARPETFLALAVGDSVSHAYQRMACRRNRLEGVRITTLDELYPLPREDPRCFGARLSRELGTQTGAVLERFDPDAPDPDREAQRMEEQIGRAGVSAVVLGLGPNGHVAFNEPDQPLDAPSRHVELTEASLRHLGGRRAIAPATGAMTLGLRALLSAERILLVVLGEAKRRAFSKVILGPVTPRVPGSVLRLHADVTVLCTRQEATVLPDDVLRLVSASGA